MNASELSDLILADITAALGGDDIDEALRAIARTAFEVAYDDIATGTADTDTFVASVDEAIERTEPDGSDEQAARVSSVIATAAVNAATVAAAPPGSEFEWVTMQDDRVRDIHRPLHGEVRAAGDPFIVSGQPLLYPGQPVGPPEVWINCRCTLNVQPVVASVPQSSEDGAVVSVGDLPASPALAADALVAREFDAEQRKAMAKRNTAMPDGSFPIANAEDLRNAVQAIGRAKDPEKVRAHIRRRAKALDLTSLIPDSWSASAEEVTADCGCDALEAAPRGVPVPANTHDAPGWLTHPRETQRLRNYWTKGAGAAKIRWGTPNDLTRCEKHLRKYVGPFAWGTCQNLHHVVFGFFNPESRGRKGGGDPDEMIDMIDAAFTAAAELEDDMDSPTMLAPPLEWFQDPGFDAATPLTVTSDGRVLGHLASWDTCHVGITGECVKPPRSKTGYAHFRTGEVETSEGELVAVGQITMDTGHAGKEAGPQATVAHYDDTGTGVADVAAGEDEYGIWVAGAMRPGVSEQQLYVLKATGALSGDWRRIGGNLELVAALAVNVPGFPIPRVAMAASAGGQALSLVAAAVVTNDPNAMTEDRIIVAVGKALDGREAAAKRAQRAAALTATLNTERVNRLLAVMDESMEDDECGERRVGETVEDYKRRLALCLQERELTSGGDCGPRQPGESVADYRQRLAQCLESRDAALASVR